METPQLLYIDGAWCEASDGRVIELTDPASEAPIGTVPWASSSDVERALAAAARGFNEWRATDAWTRSAVLRRVGELVRDRVEDIARDMTAEQGKPLAEARAEVLAAAEQFDWYADEARRVYGRIVPAHSTGNRIFVVKEPIGPVAAFTAWNFPALLPARKIAPALATGCSIILKPAEEAPRTALWLAWACHQAGVPAGVVNVITGDPSEISGQLLSSPVIRKVTLTGSVAVGKTLLRQAADGVKAVTMELGGHGPVIVCEDADVEVAAQLSVRAKFRNCGQVCISPSRFFVHERLAERFHDAVIAATSRLRVGPGSDPDTEVGPLSNRRRLDAVEALVRDAQDRGARTLVGGARLGDRGYFYAPTVLTEVPPDADVMTTEPFGPLMPIAPFSDLDDALARANSVPYGLAGYVFTRDLSTAWRVSDELQVGMVGVNNLAIATAEAPFGGVKESGIGREGGSEGVESYTVTKYINVAL